MCTVTQVKGLTFKRMVVLSTVAKATCLIESKDKLMSLSDIENIVRNVAVNHGATGELLSILLRYLPTLIFEAQSSDLQSTDAHVSLPLIKQYEIWTGGEHKIVKDICKYKDQKNSFAFWVDITKRECAASGKTKKYLKPTALRLLLFLSEHIGTSVSCRDVFKHITGNRPEQHKGWKELLNVYLTQLQNFAQDDFRKLYLVTDRLKDTLGLKESFRNKYFVVLTLSSRRD